ncbi:MAG: carbohydrate kinase, partial [Lachnospiraceae bacterium]|nr:carbohydrate kinase [Lachnospiraceae bacterium]
MKKYLMGIDAGHTSSKAVIFDFNGNVVSESSTPSMHFERRAEGFEEFDVDELWKLVQVCIKKAIQEAGIDAEEIAGIGVTSFGNGVVFLDKEGNSIAPGCFSQDYRANDIIALYKKEGSYDKINDIVKGELFAGEPGPILRWYKEHEREVYDKIGGILTFKDYIMYRLTSVFAADLNCLGGSCMVDVCTMEYSTELMELYGISELTDALPKLAADATEIVGTVTEEAARLTGLAKGTPVAAGMMDILASLVGAGGTGEDIYTAVAGSWCINETHSDKIVPGISFNMPYLRKGEYLNISCTGASSSNYEWFTQVLGGTAKLEAQERGGSFYKILDELIESVPIEKAKVFFSPFIAQPSIHVNAKANFFNIDLDTSYA